MNWYHSPSAVNQLAAQYVLGTLQGRARRRFVAVMAQRPEVAAQVQDWEAQLHRLAQRLPEVQPSPALWERLARQTALPAATKAKAATNTAGPAPAARAVAPGQVVVPAQGPVPGPSAARPLARPQAPGLLQRLAALAQRLFSPLPAGALAFGLMAGLALPLVQQALKPVPATGEDGAPSVPASYIGVLATPQGQPGLIVASLRHGRTADLKQLSPQQPPSGQTLFLWTLDAQGQARPVGPIPAGAFVQAALPDTAEKVFAQAVELGVTVEALGSQPKAPAGPWVYRGLCGKVWRAPPASAPTPNAAAKQ